MTNKARGETAVKGTDYILVPSYANIAKLEELSGMGIFEFAAKAAYTQLTMKEMIQFVWVLSGTEDKIDHVGELFLKDGIANLMPYISNCLEFILNPDSVEAAKKSSKGTSKKK